MAGRDSRPLFVLDSLNENSILTARFSNYLVDSRRDGLYICAHLEPKQLPEFQYGYQLESGSLLVSLCNLHLDTTGKDQRAATNAIIDWCKKYAHPYYLDYCTLGQYDWRQRSDADYWDTIVNVLENYEFPLQQMLDDLLKLYEDTEILRRFSCVRANEPITRKLPNTERAQQYENIGNLEEKAQLRIMERFISELPRTSLALLIDEVGDFKMQPRFMSVFDAAYYSLVRLSITPAEHTSEYGEPLPIGVCDCCGRLFVKNGNRQKFCDDIECKKERNRRKSRTAYLHKKEQQS